MSILPQTTPVERTRVFRDEWAIRYGVLMGGTAKIDLPGIGQYWVGHFEIPRRQLIGFTRQLVAGRNEAEDSADLDRPGGALLSPSPLESARHMDKSPAVCMREMMMTHGPKGFINSQVLMGDETTADQIFNAVLPQNIAERPLVDVIEFLEHDYANQPNFLGNLQPRAELFREECLQGAYVAREYMTAYTNAISEEIGQVGEKRVGKRKVDSVDIQYFWELKKTLPEMRPLEATAQLGKEIAGAMKTNDNSALVAALEEQNKLKAEELALRRLELESTERLSAKRPSPQSK